MSNFIFENPAKQARRKLQQIERNILLLREQHEDDDARAENEQLLWDQHAAILAANPELNPTEKSIEQQAADLAAKQLEAKAVQIRAEEAVAKLLPENPTADDLEAAAKELRSQVEAERQPLIIPDRAPQVEPTDPPAQVEDETLAADDEKVSLLRRIFT